MFGKPLYSQSASSDDYSQSCISKRGSLACVLEPLNSIAIKIGNTRNWKQRAKSYRDQCKVLIEHRCLSRRIPFAYLLEEIVHEMLMAHQHDIACHCCNKIHTELYWFHQGYGFEKYQDEMFYAVVRMLSPVICKWMEAIMKLEHLHRELRHGHLATQAYEEFNNKE